MNDKKYAVIPVISGIATAFPFIFESLYFLVFISVFPTFFCLIKSRKKAFRIMFFYFFSFYFFSDIWLLGVGTNFLSSETAGFFLSVLIIALVTLILTFSSSVPFILLKNLKIKNPVITSLIIGFLYIFIEWLHGFPVPGFPWNRLCNITACNYAVIQSASIFGGLFISLVIILVNLCFAYFFLYINTKKFHAVMSVVSAVLIFTSNVIIGAVSDLHYSIPKSNSHEVMIVQPCYTRKIKQKLTARQMLDGYLKLCNESITDNTKLVVFPETAISNLFFTDKDFSRIIYDFSSENNVEILFGTLLKEDAKKYNACVLVSPDRTHSEIYIKRVLVPFGEYTPALFPQNMQFLTTTFDKGTKPELITGKLGKIGCSICFESVFPKLSREAVMNNSEVIAVLTNDSWIGDSAPLYQHHTHSIMRAVENRKYTITAANTGISSVIAPNGEIISVSDTNKIQTITANVSANNIKTFYTRYGDIIILPALVVVIYLVVINLISFYRIIKNKIIFQRRKI